MDVNDFWKQQVDKGYRVEICRRDLNERLDETWAVERIEFTKQPFALPTSADRPRRRVSARDRVHIVLLRGPDGYRCHEEREYELVSTTGAAGWMLEGGRV